MQDEFFVELLDFMKRIPGLEKNVFGSGIFEENGNWWIKFQIDITHALAWHVVQEVGFVVNYISLDERLPTVFYPVSPPPYLNGGPEFLSWVIESKDPDFSPTELKEWLESRMPNPVDDLSQWDNFDDEDGDDE